MVNDGLVTALLVEDCLFSLRVKKDFVAEWCCTIVKVSVAQLALCVFVS